MIGVARTGSVYLTMSVTLERYFAIVRPLSSFYMKRWLVPISIVFAIFYNFPRFFELERYIFLPTNETLVRGTTLRQNQLYISIYNTWMKMVSTFSFFYEWNHYSFSLFHIYFFIFFKSGWITVYQSYRFKFFRSFCSFWDPAFLL